MLNFPAKDHFKSSMSSLNTSAQIRSHLQLLLDSYLRVTGRPLIEASNEDLIALLDNASFALVSHGTEVDPIFNYGNRTALKLFAMSWEEFTQLPSRYSAEAPNREERAQLLQQVKTKGYIDHYRGVRIDKHGRRFLIEEATVWNVYDIEQTYHGQAAAFSRWHYL